MIHTPRPPGNLPVAGDEQFVCQCVDRLELGRVLLGCRVTVCREPVFDLIYVDGEHHAASALEDAILSFPLLKVGGAMVFDDCGGPPDHSDLALPTPGVQAFVNVFRDRIQVTHNGWQVHIVKTSHECGNPQCRCKTPASGASVNGIAGGPG